MENKKFERKDKERLEERLVRILSTDIPGNLNVYVGLTRIKGISWSFSNIICRGVKIDKTRKIGSLTEEEINKISKFMESIKVPSYLTNRRNDFDSGENKHIVTNELDLKKEFDIKRLRKIKSYRGMRHAAKLPVRGQRTKSHFRKNRGKSGGIKKKEK